MNPAGTSSELSLRAAVDRVVALAAGDERTLLGITGPPGAGKSTFAAGLAARLNDVGLPTVVIPMDGFHLAHARLEERGLVRVKGAPETFDATGYLNVLQRIRLQRQRDDAVWAPEFDRSIEDAIAGSIEIRPEHRVVVTEGNYLLLDRPPWSAISDLLDECWYVDPPRSVRLSRLVARHRLHGRSDTEAHAHAHGSDERNAELIAGTRDRADWIVDP